MLKKLFIAIFSLILIFFGGFVAWGSTPLQPMPEALAALQSDRLVKQTSARHWVVFQPAGAQPRAGLIYYPGGRVDYRAYAPYLHEVAAQGFTVVLVKMPLSLAVFAPGRAGEVIEAFPEVKTWVVGGHSLGGAMAANYAATNPQRVGGLLLVASYPAEGDSLAGQGLPVLSIYGSRDGLATGDKIEASRALLPADTRFLSIEGGNHAQFGWYGLQPGDGEAAVSREEQQAQSVSAIIDFLRSVEAGRQ